MKTSYFQVSISRYLLLYFYRLIPPVFLLFIRKTEVKRIHKNNKIN